MTSYVGFAATELKKNGKFKLGGVLNMKLKKKPARAAKKGVNPFAKEPCVSKGKPAGKTVKKTTLKRPAALPSARPRWSKLAPVNPITKEPCVSKAKPQW